MRVEIVSPTKQYFNGAHDWKGKNERYYRNAHYKPHSLHRAVWEYHNGKIPEGMVIDHIDRNTDNNQIENLRCVTLSENARNISSEAKAQKKFNKEVKELQAALENAAPQDTEALAAAQKRIAELEQENADLRDSKTIEPDEALRIEADAAIEAEKAWLLEELERETGFKYRFDGTAVHNDEVSEMVAGRAAFEQELVNALNATNRSFRDSTSEATAAIAAACEELRKNLEQQTNSAINAVVDTSRRLQGTDFRDLLDAFRSLETQLYYKSRSGTETPEFKEYWKAVRFFLKKLENTLNKLGFLRYLPEVGADLDPDTMEALEVDDDYPADPEEYPMYTVKEIVSGGFMDKTGEYPEIKALVIAQYQE